MFKVCGLVSRTRGTVVQHMVVLSFVLVNKVFSFIIIMEDNNMMCNSPPSAVSYVVSAFKNREKL